MGPLRQPMYLHTAYFDFSGVNGNTESHSRYTHFERITTSKNLPTLNLEALRALFVDERFLKQSFEDRLEEYKVGVPLQVEDDSNILAFSNNFNNFEVIRLVKSKTDSYLIRKHPSGHCEYGEAQDKSQNSIEFIKKVEKVVTINSSVGFEALLYGKESQILGDSPFAFLLFKDLTAAERLKRINFILFGYLIPFHLMYDANYYRWRLSNPTEEEIYLFHFHTYHRMKDPKWNAQNLNSNSENLLLKQSLNHISLFYEKKIQEFENQIIVLEQKIQATEARALAIENQLQATEARAIEGEHRAQIAENRIQATESRVIAAEKQTHAAEYRAQAAESRAADAELRAQAAEARALTAIIKGDENLKNLKAIEAAYDHFKSKFTAIENSTIWKSSALVRKVADKSKKLFRTHPKTIDQ